MADNWNAAHPRAVYLVDQGTGDPVGSSSSTAVVTNVDDGIASVALLAAEPDRIGGTIYNDSSSILYIKYGATASATSFTVKLFGDDYHMILPGYTGQIDGIWSANGSGAARITEVVRS